MCRYIYAVVLALCCLEQFLEAMPTEFIPAQMPEVCAGQNFCTMKNNYYPEDVMESLLLKFDGMWKEITNETITDKRQSDLYENQCKYRPIREPIHLMVDKNENVRYVVQSKLRFNQVIYMEECEKIGPITEGTTSLSRTQVEKHHFECKQKYIDYKFLVLSLDGTTLEAIGMKGGVPVCCSCVLKTLAKE